MKKMLSATLFALALVGCASDGGSEDAAPQTVNALCPQMQKPVSADAGTVEWKGLTIGFCCDECPTNFEARDDAEKIAALKDVDVEVDA